MIRAVHWTRISLVAGLALGLAACSQESPSPIDPADGGGLRMATAPTGAAVDPETVIEVTNARLESDGAPYRLGMIETISGDPDQLGATFLWKNVGNKQLGFDFVPGDPRRLLGSPEGGWSTDPNSMTYTIDPNQGITFNGVGQATTDGEIHAAMGTWDGVRCSDLNLTFVPAPGDVGVIGGSGIVIADITHGGWLDIEYTATTIAATHTFVWIDDDGNLTDIDGNGVPDVAFREIYYDAICQGCDPQNFWAWEVDNGANDPGIDVDIQSIVLHEAGHGLSQAHFGAGFVTPKNGKLHLTSNSVMAAAYVFPRTDLQGSDTGGHCSNWGSWPKN